MDQFVRNMGKFAGNNFSGGIDAGLKKVVESIQDMLDDIEKKK